MCDNASMATVLRLFWGICLLRLGPEQVPTRTWFLCALLAAHLAIAAVRRALVWPELSTPLALNVALIGLAVIASITWFALYIRHFETRFPATLGAILGTSLVIEAAYLAVYGVTSGVVREGAFWLCLLWEVTVVGFILHRALSWQLWAGVLLAVGTQLVGLVVIQAALGPALLAALSDTAR